MDRWTEPRRLALAMLTGLIVLFLVIPIIIIVPVGLTSSESIQFPPRGLSLRWYADLIEDPNWRRALINSLQVAAGTLVLSLVLGIPMALGLTRGKFPGQRLVSGLVLTPLVMPTLIVAIGVYYVWTMGWSIGPLQFGGKMTGSAFGMILAHTSLAIPMVVVLVSASLRTMDRTLELAAAGLGAGPWARFRTITTPLMMPGVAAGAVFSFLISWDEALVSLFLTTARFQTFPVRMFTQVREAVDPSVASAATILIATTTCLFTFALLSRTRSS